MNNILFLLFTCAIPLIIFILPMAGFEKTVEKLDWFSPFYVFTLQFGIAVLLFIRLFKDFAAWLKSLVPNPQSLIPVFIITLIAVSICFFWIEGRSRTQQDESLYLITAQNIYHNYIGVPCKAGAFSDKGLDCAFASTVKPRGLSYLYALGMHIFGTDLRWVYNFQTFILFLMLPVFFLAILAWTKNRWLSLLAVALLANCPVLLFYSRSASIEGLYVFMFALSLLFLKWAWDRNTTRHWILLALTLAFFAQTRTETVLCLFAFIGVALYRMCYLPSLSEPEFTEFENLQNEKRTSLQKLYQKCKHTYSQFSILNSQFPIFLATLSAFSIPVLCTISLNRNSDLQSGPWGAHGHLLENIITDFKIMAFTSYNSEGIFYNPYFPYFTWFALFGLITLIVLTIKEFKNKEGNFSIKYSHIALFLLLLSPQYLILFDSVSADFNLDIQQRFALIILPAMAFLGALFIMQIFKHIKNTKIPLILLIMVLTINTLIHYESFKSNIIHDGNASIAEHYQLQKFTSKLKEPSVFFAFTTFQILDKGISTYGYDLLANVEENVLDELFKTYHGNVFAVEDSQCKFSHSVQKMIAGETTRACDRIISYFDVDTVLNVNLVKNTKKTLLVYKILGMNERDRKGLLRIFNKREPTQDSVHLIFRIPKDTSVTWKVLHFLNDEFIKDSPYKRDYFTDSLEFSQFNRDTNIWRLDIVDTITNEKIHSDFWQLVKVKQGR
jgi:hypothetical protein